jgi:hypothetical protein
MKSFVTGQGEYIASTAQYTTGDSYNAFIIQLKYVRYRDEIAPLLPVRNGGLKLLQHVLFFLGAGGFKI